MATKGYLSVVDHQGYVVKAADVKYLGKPVKVYRDQYGETMTLIHRIKVEKSINNYGDVHMSYYATHSRRCTCVHDCCGHWFTTRIEADRVGRKGKGEWVIKHHMSMNV